MATSEAFYRATFDHAAVGIMHVAPDGQLLRVNDKLCAILGYTRAALLQLKFDDFTFPADLAEGTQARHAMLAGRQASYSVDKRYRRLNGEIFWGNLASTLVREKGEPEYFISVIQDVTPRKEAEHHLHRLNRLHAVLSRIGEAIVRTREPQLLYQKACQIVVQQGRLGAAWITRCDGETGLMTKVAAFGSGAKFLADAQFHGHAGPSSDGTIGTAMKTGRYDVCNNIQDDPRMAPWHAAAHDNGYLAVASFPFTINRRTDTVLTMVSGEAGYFRTDEIKLMADVASDLSFAIESIRSEESIRVQARMLDNIGQAVVATDVAGKIIYSNRFAGELFDWIPAAIVGQDFHAVTTLGTTPEQHRQINERMERGENWHGELAVLTRGGRRFIAQMTKSPVFDLLGKFSGIIGISTDITDKKKHEAQLLRNQRMESIGTLAGGIAHDLNNVLAPILMGVAMLKEKHADPDSIKLFAMLEQNTKRGAQLIRQVLAFGRGAEGERILLQPAHIAREIGEIIRDTFPKSIRYEEDLPQDVWTLTGDSTQLHQVLLNLCVNARDAMPDGGTLTLSLANRVLAAADGIIQENATPGPYVVITVSDTGGGVPLAIRERIFEPFFTTKEVGKGTGLGLSTTLAIVKGHFGFIDLVTVEGKGSAFTVYLPASVAAGALDDTPALSPPVILGADQCILVIDDEEPVRVVAQAMLENFGYRVFVAENGVTAVALYERHHAEIDAVITDMAMPFMDGPTTVRALRKINPGVKIIGSSGMGSGIYAGVASATGVGIEHFISKPYTAETMLKALHEILGEGVRRHPLHVAGIT